MVTPKKLISFSLTVMELNFALITISMSKMVKYPFATIANVNIKRLIFSRYVLGEDRIGKGMS